MITINIIYKGENDNALKFVKEMIEEGIVEKIRNEKGNIRYEYFVSYEKPNEVLLVDAWKDQEALDIHHGSDMMEKIKELRDKYDLHMSVERYVSIYDNPEDEKYMRK